MNNRFSWCVVVLALAMPVSVLGVGCASLQRGLQVASEMASGLERATGWCASHGATVSELAEVTRLLEQGQPLAAAQRVAALVERARASGDPVPPEVLDAIVRAVAAAE